MKRWWLARGNGSRVRLGSAPLVLGRATDCHVVVLDRRVSSRHAMISLTVDGPELVTFGRNPVLVDGQPAERTQLLHDGAQLQLAGETLVVSCSGEGRAAPPIWALEITPTILQCPRKRRFTVGGGDDDTIVLPSWPAGAIRFEQVQEALLMLPLVPALLDARPLRRGELVSVRDGERVEIGGVGFRMFCQGATGPETTVGYSPDRPVELARFTFLPNGGALGLRLDGQWVELRLSELRCNLVGALLGAHSSFAAGERIPDNDLVQMIWPNQADRSNLHLNQIIHRFREALLEAGIDPLRVLERPKGAGYTRFRLGPDSRVELI